MEKTTVSITVEVDGQQKTFTATTETGGSPFAAAQGLINAVRTDASDWGIDVKTAKQNADHARERAQRQSHPASPVQNTARRAFGLGGAR